MFLIEWVAVSCAWSLRSTNGLVNAAKRQIACNQEDVSNYGTPRVIANYNIDKTILSKFEMQWAFENYSDFRATPI